MFWEARLKGEEGWHLRGTPLFPDRFLPLDRESASNKKINAQCPASEWIVLHSQKYTGMRGGDWRFIKRDTLKVYKSKRELNKSGLPLTGGLEEEEEEEEEEESSSEDSVDLTMLKVKELKELLKTKGLNTTGKKAELVERLQQAQ